MKIIYQPLLIWWWYLRWTSDFYFLSSIMILNSCSLVLMLNTWSSIGRSKSSSAIAERPRCRVG